jgi:hypothetical protein
MKISSSQLSGLQQNVETALIFQCVKIIAATHMRATDENLRKGRPSIGPAQHFLARTRLYRRIMFHEGNALLGKKTFGGCTIATTITRIDCHINHLRTPLFFYIGIKTSGEKPCSHGEIT